MGDWADFDIDIRTGLHDLPDGSNYSDLGVHGKTKTVFTCGRCGTNKTSDRDRNGHPICEDCK